MRLDAIVLYAAERSRTDAGFLREFLLIQKGSFPHCLHLNAYLDHLLIINSVGILPQTTNK